MSNDFGNLVRVVRNLYNAVHERPGAKRNSPFRYSVNGTGVLIIREVTSGIARLPEAVAYEDLTNTGSAYNPLNGLGNGEEITYVSNILDVDQGWIFARLTLPWDWDEPGLGAFPILFDWNDGSDGTARIVVYVNTAAHTIEGYRRSSASAYYGQCSLGMTHQAGDSVTIAFSWDSSVGHQLWYKPGTAAGFAVGVNHDHEASGTLADGTLLAMEDRFNIGWPSVDLASANVDFPAVVQYFIAGKGLLTTEVVETFHQFGDSDPEIYDVLQFIEDSEQDTVFLWPGISLAHQPFAIVGESLAG